MVTSTRRSTGFADAVVMVPENSAKVPRTLLIRWRTVKPTSECEASMVQVPVTRSVVCDLLGHEMSPWRIS